MIDAAIDVAIDVVIVNYNTADHLRSCLASLDADLADRRVIGEIVVVDNASSDRSRSVVAEHAGVRWLETGANLGFGSAANRGVAATTAAFVLVLNPDATVCCGAIAEMADAMRNDRVGAVGPRVENPDGTVYPSTRSFPRVSDSVGHAFIGLFTTENRWSRRYLAPDHPDWVSGTAMLLRRREIGRAHV